MSFSHPIFVILAIVALGLLIASLYFAVSYRKKAARNALLAAIAMAPLAVIVFIVGVAASSQHISPA
jgi:cytochrome c oxidase subunit IV